MKFESPQSLIDWNSMNIVHVHGTVIVVCSLSLIYFWLSVLYISWVIYEYDRPLVYT